MLGVSQWSIVTDARIDLLTLRALTAVGETGSVGGAAARLGLSQQAVSARIRAAEQRVGCNLLHRSPRGSALTDEGRIIVEWGVPLLAADAAFAASVSSLTTAEARRLAVAASQSISEAFMPAWILRFRRGDADASVQLSSGNSDWVLARVREDRARLGFIETPVIPQDLHATQVGVDRLVVAVEPGHPWAQRDEPLTAGELGGTPLVTRERGSGTRETLDQALAANGCLGSVEAAAELSSTGAIRSAILAGLAPGVISRALVADDLASGRLVTVPVAFALVRPLTAVWRGVLSADARAFLEAATGR